MEVKGRDPATECYRVVHDVDGMEVTALVPERFAVDFRIIGSRPSHQSAYVWMAENKSKIENAIAQLASGNTPRAPFDQITIVKEH